MKSPTKTRNPAISDETTLGFSMSWQPVSPTWTCSWHAWLLGAHAIQKKIATVVIQHGWKISIDGCEKHWKTI
jgi:hypothetical protein